MKEIKEIKSTAQEISKVTSIIGYAAFVKNGISNWTQAISPSFQQGNPVLPYGWYQNRDDAILAGSASYYSNAKSIKLISAVFEVEESA